MTDPVLRTEVDGGILTLWLNRPEKRNALNGAMVAALASSLKDAETMEDVAVVLLRGEGKDFCAGADLEELERATQSGAEASMADALRLGDLLLGMRRFPRPILAAVQGRALAGGCGLATACDLILAQEDAEFGYPEVHLGFVPAMVMAILRQKLGEGQAFQLVALGNRISAVEAHRLGLVHRLLPGGADFETELRAFAMDLASRPRSALTLIKGLLHELPDLSVEEGIRRGAEVNVEARMTEACRDGVQRFLARRRSGPP